MRASDTSPVQVPTAGGPTCAPPEPATPDLRSKRRNTILILVTFILCVGYMAAVLKRGWYPHDEGTLAQSAERVLYGEIPHKDFDEIYTGGLTFLNAAAFRLLGVNLATLRALSFTLFLVWVPVLLYIARQFASVPVAC